MIAVTTNNTSFDEEFDNSRCKASLVYITKTLFVMWPNSNRAHFMAVRCRNTLLARDIKISLGFSAGALKDATKIWEFSLTIITVLLTISTLCQIKTTFKMEPPFYFISIDTT